MLCEALERNDHDVQTRRMWLDRHVKEYTEVGDRIFWIMTLTLSYHDVIRFSLAVMMVQGWWVLLVLLVLCVAEEPLRSQIDLSIIDEEQTLPTVLTPGVLRDALERYRDKVGSFSCH